MTSVCDTTAQAHVAVILMYAHVRAPRGCCPHSLLQVEADSMGTAETVVDLGGALLDGGDFYLAYEEVKHEFSHENTSSRVRQTHDRTRG